MAPDQCPRNITKTELYKILNRDRVQLQFFSENSFTDTSRPTKDKQTSISKKYQSNNESKSDGFRL